MVKLIELGKETKISSRNQIVGHKVKIAFFIYCKMYRAALKRLPIAFQWINPVLIDITAWRFRLIYKKWSLLVLYLRLIIPESFMQKIPINKGVETLQSRVFGFGQLRLILQGTITLITIDYWGNMDLCSPWNIESFYEMTD